MNRRDFLRFSILNLQLLNSTKLIANGLIENKTEGVLLKLDDFMPNSAGDLSVNWKRTINFLAQNNIPASFGVLGDNLFISSNKFLKEVSGLSKTGLFEFWNHGYSNKNNSPVFEDTINEQYIRFCEIQEWVKSMTGNVSEFFGPHSGNINPATFYALSKIKEIKGIWFYKAPVDLAQRFVVVPRIVEAEKPIFYPNEESIMNGIKANGIKVLQFHPNTWADETFEDFTVIVKRLLRKGVEFRLPSAILRG